MEESSAELKASLEWRRACARFRRALLAAATGTSRADMAELLRSGDAGLARLSGRAAPAGLPAAEGVRLQDLREGIAAWLREDPRDLAAGARLWQELFDLAQALSGVSQRPEVREHDLDLLSRVRKELGRTRIGVQTVPPVVRVLLSGLFGRDDELDELLERRGRLVRADLDPVLARLAELSQAEAHSGETVH